MSQYTRQFKHSRRSRALQWAVALAIGASACGAAQALRVGHSRVVSAPGAPLQALVALQDLTPEELASLKVSLADEAAWQRAGLRPPVPLASMVVKVEDGPNPSFKYARVRSADALAAPVVDLLLNVTSSSGQRQVQVSIVVPLRGSGVEVAPASVGTPTRRAGTAGSVAVKYGDTMYAIAQRHAVAGADVNQMLVALWRANPKAFIENNMNMVRAGKTLALPDAATVRAIDKAEARRIVAEHNAAYALYRARAGAAVTASPAVVRAPESTSGAVTAASADTSTSTAIATPSQDRLRISNASTQDSAAAKAEAQADAKTSTARALADAEGRVNELQSNVDALNQAIGKTASAADSSAGPGGTSTSKQAASTSGTPGATVPGSGGTPSAASPAAQNSGVSTNTNINQAGSSSASAPGGTAASPNAAAAAGAVGAAAANGSTAAPSTPVGGTASPSAAPSTAANANASAPNPSAPATSGTPAATSPVTGAEKTGAEKTAVEKTGSDNAASTTPDMAKVEAKTGQPSSDDFTSSLPTWLADNLLVIVTAILALIAFAIAWVLRRAGTRRDDDDEETYAYGEPAINTAALNNRLNNINLDLDEPPTDEPQRVDGPRT